MLLCWDRKQNFVSIFLSSLHVKFLLAYLHLPIFYLFVFYFHLLMQLRLLFYCLFWINFQ